MCLTLPRLPTYKCLHVTTFKAFFQEFKRSSSCLAPVSARHPRRRCPPEGREAGSHFARLVALARSRFCRYLSFERHRLTAVF